MATPGKRITLITHVAALLLFSFVFFFNGIGSYSLKEPDEGRYGEIPREMVETGDYVVPHLNYARYFEKPPLFYWTVALSYKIFGTDEWALRFPNALSALLCVLGLYFFAGRWFGRQIAFIGAMILMSSMGFFAMAKIVTLDMFFTLWLFLSLMFFYGYYRERKPLFIYLFYAAMGLATLTKGPVAIILLGLTIFAYLVIERDISFLKEMKWVKGLILYLLVTLPWIVAISLREKEFLSFFIVDQNFLRFLTSKHKRTGSVFYFFPVLFAGMLPWSFFIPRSFAALWAKKELRLFFIWIIVVFAFFSVSKSKLPPYILPLFPVLSLVLACFFHEKWSEKSAIAETVACIALFALFASSILLYRNAAFAAYIAAISGEASRFMRDLRGFTLGFSCLSLFVLVLLLRRVYNRLSFLFPLFIVFSSGVAIMLMLNVDTIDRINTMKRFAHLIKARSPAPERIVNYGAFDETLPFYLKGKVTIANYTGELEMGSKYDDAKDIFMSESEFAETFLSPERTVVLLKAKRLKWIGGIPGDKIKVIECSNERCLISNY
ncbi:MAG TPA: glycosyltransferase family 39 protein [Syntrophorhabdaceae bacterium]|jgi:hypothetical protein